jgi:hypothetical protein
LTACKRDNEPRQTQDVNERLVAKKQLYCELSKPAYEKVGYVHGRCDGLLFTALRGIGCGDVDIGTFQNAEGRWYRDPEHDCFIADRPQVENGSDSSISKDMMVGAMNYLWWSKDLPKIDATIKYGKANNWVMGDAVDFETTSSKCLLSPGLVSLLFDMQENLSLGSISNTSQRTDVIPINTGFRAHLDVLHILLSGSVFGALTDSEVETLKKQAKRQPRNALFQAAYHLYTDGDQTIATELLMDESHFPNDKLPTNHDNHCTEYLYQRDDEPKDWSPCADGKLEEYSGTDLAFAVSIIDGSFLKRKP